MYTILISLLSSTAAGIGIYFIYPSYILSVITGIILLVLINFTIGKHFLKKLTLLFQSVEKDLKSDRTEKAIEKLNEGYGIANWQLFVKEQINAQIGIIHYSKKKFEESRPYLEKGFNKNWMAMSMKAALAFKDGDMDKVRTVMDKATKGSPKEGFLYSLYAYFMVEAGDKDKAIEVLQKGVSKSPLDEKLGAILVALQNNKKIKMQNYGAVWLQLHLSKTPQGAKPYQMLLQNQRVKRR